MTLTYVLLGGLLAASTGLAFRFVGSRASNARADGHTHVTWTEFVLGTLLCTLVVAPVVTVIGFDISKTNLATYNEWWSGRELQADRQPTTCNRDGSCRHTYECDAYQVMVTKTRQVPYPGTETYTDSQGRTQTRSVTKYRTETYQEPETRYHSCPYVTHEYTYTVTDTLDETYEFGDHWFPANPDEHRWKGDGYRNPRWGFGMPELPNVASGEPKAWAAAKRRIDSGNPGGTTVRKTYRNPILASQEDIYAKSSSAIDRYRKSGDLPKIVTSVHDQYLADKVYFVGPAPANTKPSQWQEEAMRLNGDLGSKRQGDLHLVIVTDPSIVNADEYTNALAAYWQSDALGKDTLSKNGIGVVLGVSGSSEGAPTVAWSRAFTGMPEGNEALLVALRDDLTGTPATPETLLAPETGVLAGLLTADGAGFKRVEMADYEYLFDRIEPTGTARFMVLFVGLLLSIGVWAGFLYVDVRVPEHWTRAIRDARTARQARQARQTGNDDEEEDWPAPEPYPCGHAVIERGCGGCDPGAIEFVRDDTDPPGTWRRYDPETDLASPGER